MDKAHTQPCCCRVRLTYRHSKENYLELPVGGEVLAPVEASVELHPVPGDAPDVAGDTPGPGSQLGVAEEGAALGGKVVAPRLQSTA